MIAPPTGHSPTSLHLLGTSNSLRHNDMKIRPITNTTMASKCSRKRKGQPMYQKFHCCLKEIATVTLTLQHLRHWSALINIEIGPSTSKKIMISWKLRWWLDYNVNITLTCTRKPKISCDTRYCNVCFIAMICNWTRNISEVCLYMKCSE